MVMVSEHIINQTDGSEAWCYLTPSGSYWVAKVVKNNKEYYGVHRKLAAAKIAALNQPTTISFNKPSKYFNIPGDKNCTTNLNTTTTKLIFANSLLTYYLPPEIHRQYNVFCIHNSKTKTTSLIVFFKDKPHKAPVFINCTSNGSCSDHVKLCCEYLLLRLQRGDIQLSKENQNFALLQKWFYIWYDNLKVQT